MTVVGRVVAAGLIVAGSIALGGAARADTSIAYGGAAQAGTMIAYGGAAQVGTTIGQGDSSGQITSPSDGQVVSDSSVTVSARTGLMQLRIGLYVEGPSTPSQKVAGGGANQTISGTFAAGDAPNGTFTVTLKGEITGTRYATSTFKLRRPAEAPGDVNASKQGTSKVLVTWSKGSEPDLQSYEVSNTQSGVVGRLPADSACAGSSCKAVLGVPAKAAGQKVGFTVKAFRGDGDGGSIGSGESAAAYISFPAAPTAQPTKKTTTGNDQTPKSRDARGVDALPTLPAKKQTLPSAKPTTRKPTTTKLPDLPDADPNGNLPIPTADAQGDNGELAPADAKEDGGDTAPVQSDGVKAQSNESPIGGLGQYGLYVAGGILLLLLGAHAGAWARRRSLATGAGGSVPAPSALGDGGAPTGGAQVARVADHEAHVGEADGNVTPATTAPRRPAVILAVARTRVPEQPSRAQRIESGGEPVGLGAEALSHVGEVSSQPSAAPSAAPSVTVSEQGRLQSPSRDQVRREDQVRGEVARRGDVDREPGADTARGGGQRPGREGSLGLEGLAGLEGRGGYEGPPRLEARPGLEGSGGGLEGRPGPGGSGGDKGPGHIALPSSAVTDVPEPSAPTVTPAVRLEERWNDYLPPSPRSMEDSGFWERPQPGAADFWAADDDGADDGSQKGDERVYASRRHRGGES
ncbi:hypothetical protein [Nonomuraea sp. NPDC049709]|uniref:hypothetical protein n=1 Tax=Nonomuraea sp. NPDC049709 TaxID=3154736 RepID=UPI0034219F5B